MTITGITIAGITIAGITIAGITITGIAITGITIAGITITRRIYMKIKEQGGWRSLILLTFLISPHCDVPNMISKGKVIPLQA